MIFTKQLRAGVRRGRITCSVRFWTSPHVKVGGRYRMDEGKIEVDSIREITLLEITPDLARRSGFKAWPISSPSQNTAAASASI